MRNTIFLILIMTSGLLYSQVGNENVSYSSGLFFTRANRPTTIEYKIDGTPFIEGKDFKKVIIKGYSSNVQPLRYNAYEDEMEFDENGDIFYTEKQEGLIIDFPTLNKKYQCVRYSYLGRPYFGYLVLLSEGKQYNLYKREKIELIEGLKSPSAYGKDENDYFSRMQDIYLFGNTEDGIVELPNNRRKLVEFFTNINSDVPGFIKTNKLNLNKEPDLIKLVNYINS